MGTILKTKQKKERVSIPELRALCFEINREYFNADISHKVKRMFSLPSGSLRNVIILEYKRNLKVPYFALINDEKTAKYGWVYHKTHKFDYPRLAKKFLLEELKFVISLTDEEVIETRRGG